MTWNLWGRFGPWEPRLEAILAVISREQPDVLMLQEVWRDGGDSSARRIAESLGHHLAVTDGASEGEVFGFHNALVSRWPLANVESLALPDAAGQPGHRRLLIADAATPWGPWPLASTHLDYRFDDSALRRHQAARLLAHLDRRRGDAKEDLPVVLGGDLNAVPDSDEIRMLTGRTAGPVPGLVLSDCWELVGEGHGHTWRADNPYQADSAWPNRRLDYVMVSWPRQQPAGNPLLARLAGLQPVGGVVPSDHAAVVVELQTPP